MRIRESSSGRQRRLCDDFFVAAELYAVSTIDFNCIKTFLQERLSMQITYMYIHFNDFTLFIKSTKGFQAFPILTSLLSMFYVCVQWNGCFIVADKIFSQFIVHRFAKKPS